MTEETAKQFVERFVGEEILECAPAKRDDWYRLLSLALRGAETQWRPIEEFSESGRNSEVIASTSYGYVAMLTGFEKVDILPSDYTHFIPLTALGSPKP